MAPLLGGLLKAAASALLMGKRNGKGGLGGQLQEIALEKVTSIAREKLNLPPEAPEVDIEDALAADPAAYAAALESVNEWRMEQERTFQVAVEQQGLSERAAMSSESAFIRNARPMMLYLGGLSCFALIVFGALIVWTEPASLPDFVKLVSAVAMPLSALLAAGGVYAYRRTTDKAIGKGLDLPSLINLGGKS